MAGLRLRASNDPRYYMISRNGAKRVGARWPAGAKYAPRSDRHAIIYADGSSEVLKRPLHDVLLTARLRVLEKRSEVAIVARPVGRFDDGANLYRPVELLSMSDEAAHEALGVKHSPHATKAGYRRGVMAIKAIDAEADDDLEEGAVKIRGVASSLEMDRDGEVVVPRAFESKIQSFLDNPVMLFNHDAWSPPIGSWTSIEILDDKIILEGVVKDRQLAPIVKRGDLRMLSIGFTIDEGGYEVREIDGKQVGHILSGELVETSIVTIPSNRAARFDVIKSVKNADPNAWIGDCVMDGVGCGCDMPSGVLEFRGLDACAPGSHFDASREAVEAAYGSDGWKTAHVARVNGEPILQVAAMVDGELRVVPELVRLSMGQVASGIVKFDDPRSRQMAWSMVGKRWMECFPGTPVPTIQEMDVDPRAFQRIAGDCVGGICFPKAAAPDEVRSWATSHGLEGGTVYEERKMTVYRTVAAKSSGKGAGSVAVTLSDGKVVNVEVKATDGEDIPEEEDKPKDDEESKATSACREAGETEEDCVRRKVPELVESEGMDEESAAAAAAEMCATECAAPAAEGESASADEGKDGDASDQKQTGADKGSTAGRKKVAAKPRSDLFAGLGLDDEEDVEVPRSAMKTLQRAINGEAVSETDLAAAIEACEEALDCDIELELEVEED